MSKQGGVFMLVFGIGMAIFDIVTIFLLGWSVWTPIAIICCIICIASGAAQIKEEE